MSPYSRAALALIPALSAASCPSAVLADRDSGNEADGRSLLALGYHRAGMRDPGPLDALWRAEIGSPPAGTGSALPILALAVDIGGGRRALVSMALQGPPACDTGPNSATSTRDYASCPGKLAILRGGVVLSSRDVGPLCGEVVDDAGTKPGAADYKDPTRWGTRVRYDAAKGAIRLTTLQDGRVERACSRVLAVEAGR